MTRGAPKIPIDAQIAAVSQSAQIVHAAADYRGEKIMTERALALDAAVRTLCWVRDHAEALRRAAGVGKGDTRRRFGELPLAQQAAMRCGEARFQKFLKVEDADQAAAAVRRACNVESRKELDAVAEAGNAWRKLDAEFAAWLRGVDGGEAAA